MKKNFETLETFGTKNVSMEPIVFNNYE